jgi:uncharacterized protein CbrC (UPF0167 family)
MRKVILVLCVSSEDDLWYAVDQKYEDMSDSVPCDWYGFQSWLKEENAELCEIMGAIAY